VKAHGPDNCPPCETAAVLLFVPVRIASRNSLEVAAELISTFKSLRTDEEDYVVNDENGKVVNLCE
jgi:hypothetical protein